MKRASATLGTLLSAIRAKGASPHRVVAAVAGPPGAGKSTLTKVMAGVVALSSGELHVEGRPVQLRVSTRQNPMPPPFCRWMGIITTTWFLCRAGCDHAKGLRKPSTLRALPICCCGFDRMPSLKLPSLSSIDRLRLQEPAPA